MRLGGDGLEMSPNLAPLERMAQQWGDEGVTEESYLAATLFLRWQTW